MSNKTHVPKSAAGARDPTPPPESRRGVILALTSNEYRLALLGLVDFAGQWFALETATAFVVDGPTKLAVIRERLLPMADELAVLLTRDVDAIELLAARYWFRNGAYNPRPDPAVDPIEATP